MVSVRSYSWLQSQSNPKKRTKNVLKTGWEAVSRWGGLVTGPARIFSFICWRLPNEWCEICLSGAANSPVSACIPSQNNVKRASSRVTLWNLIGIHALGFSFKQTSLIEQMILTAAFRSIFRSSKHISDSNLTSGEWWGSWKVKHWLLQSQI